MQLTVWAFFGRVRSGPLSVIWIWLSRSRLPTWEWEGDWQRRKNRNKVKSSEDEVWSLRYETSLELWNIHGSGVLWLMGGTCSPGGLGVSRGGGLRYFSSTRFISELSHVLTRTISEFVLVSSKPPTWVLTIQMVSYCGSGLFKGGASL